jgi:hypothetical protein
MSDLLIDDEQENDCGIYLEQVHLRSRCWHGRGVWIGKGVSSGCRYEGGYINGFRCGKGTHKCPDGRIYQGVFAGSATHGKGIY